MLTTNSGKFKIQKFHENEIPTIQEPDGNIWVVLNAICTDLGLDLIESIKQIKKFGPKWKYFVTDEQEPDTNLLFCIQHFTIHPWLIGLKGETMTKKKAGLLAKYKTEFIPFIEKGMEAA